ncbi:MAG TPA: NfeD family protein [Myxococcota bacterium]|nr:NfeD family protein [Myxococcota bacterium]
MPFWGWIVVGAALLAAETLVDAQFYFVFLGAAAIATGVLALLFGPLAPAVGWALFGVLAIAGTAGFRRRVYQRLRGAAGEVSQGTVGELAIAREAIPPGGHGSAEMRGTVWQARNSGDTAIPAGGRALVVATHGLVLELRSES